MDRARQKIQEKRCSPANTGSIAKNIISGADTILGELVEIGQVPGIAVGIHINGKVVLQKGYGFANLEKGIKTDPEFTLFRIASISKPIAATALLSMVAEGLIDLDTSFYHYVPYFPRKKYDFTIRQLAGHTAGIRGYRGKEYGLNKPFSIRESLQIFQEDPLLFKPGTDFHYNSYGWVMISLAMEEASGISFSHYVYEKVLQPLGMRNTLPERAGPQAQKASFYTQTSGGFRPSMTVDNTYKLAGGGYLSTVADIQVLGQAYLDGKIGKPGLVKEFLTPGEAGNRSSFYGLGWEVSTDSAGRPYYGHTGNSVGASTSFRVFPRQRMVFTYLINCTNPGVSHKIEEATGWFLTALDTDIT